MMRLPTLISLCVALLMGCTTHYRLSYEDAATGAEIPDSEAWSIKHGDCKDAFKASAASPSPPQPAVVTSSSEAAVQLAAYTLQILAERSKEASDEAEFLEACLLVKGIRTVKTPI